MAFRPFGFLATLISSMFCSFWNRDLVVAATVAELAC